MLNQQPICYKDETKGSYYPYMLFSISEKDTILMLEIDFVKETITFHQKDHDMKEYGFSQIKNVLQGREHDQLMIEFNFGKKNWKSFEAVYQGQRDHIVKILLYASQVYATSDSPKYEILK